MSQSSIARRTHGLRVVSGGSQLAVRVSLDFDQKLFRRNYRRPIIISAALASDACDVSRWLKHRGARLLGYDLAARTLNRLAGEAAEPLFMHAVISGGTREQQSLLRDGVEDVCVAADCALADHTAAVGDKAPLAATLSATGVVERSRMMNLRRCEVGDVVLAVGSDRLWTPLVASARKALSTFKPDKSLPGLEYDASWALVRPAPLMARAVQTVLGRYKVKRVVHTMMSVEADGLSPAIDRLLNGKFGIKKSKSRSCSPLTELLVRKGMPVEEFDEGHVLGIGYLMVASEPFAAAIARRLKRLGLQAYRFGRLAEKC